MANITEADILLMLKTAKEAEQNAVVPYSGRPNGAALLSVNGKLYTGCTIEISNFASSVCAAKVALVKAISEGARDLVAIAVTGSNVDVHYLCGDCRQSFADFGLNISVISEIQPDDVRLLSQLLPEAFTIIPGWKD